MSNITASRINEVKGNMSQEEFAKSINSSQPVISKALNGETVSINVLTDISKQYHVSVDWLLGLSPHKYMVGYSKYDSDEPVTYGDVISLFIILMRHGSISYCTDESNADNDLYSCIPGNFREKEYLEIKDHFIGDLISSASNILELSPETISIWEKKILEDYHFDIPDWTQMEENTYMSNRPFHTSLEILRDVINKKRIDREI